MFEELEVLRREGVDPAAFIWVHANSEPDRRRHVAAAELGAWVEYDEIEGVVEMDVELLSMMREHGLLGHVLVSHDNGWYEPGKPEKQFQGYAPLFEQLLPALSEHAFTDPEIEQLLVTNPARALCIGVRRTSRQLPHSG